MIMQRQPDGSYEQIGFIKSKDGETIDTIVDSKGDVYFTQGFTREISGIPPLTLDSIGKNTLDYKIYGNSVQDGTPTPENPIEVKSVRDKTKNLFNKNDATVSGYITEDGSITQGGSGWFTTENFIKCSGSISLQAKNGLGSDAYISCYDSNKVFLGSVKQSSSNATTNTIQLIEGTEYIKTCCQKNNLDSYQLELGSEATAYEPYGYKIPVVVTGKNLFDEIYPKVEQGDELDPKYLSVYVGKNHMVTLSTTVPKIKEFTNIWLLAGKVTTGANSETNGVSFDTPRTIMSNDGYVTIGYRRAGGNPSNYETQLEFGSESTPYEPYHEPVTTNIYLDEPLRKIGDYADVIDFNRWVVERKIKKIVFDGSESIRASSTIGQLRFTLSQPTVERYGYASHYEVKPIYQNSGFPYVRINTSDNVEILWFELPRNQYTDNEQAITDFKSYLAEQYDAGTPVTVYHVLAEPTTESISLPSIPTFDGTTVISTNTEIQPSSMEITYKAKKNTEV